MKKLYFFFIVLMLLISNNSYAVIMPVDSFRIANPATTNIEVKQVKLPFFKRLVFNSLLKKLTKQAEGKKPLNKVGLAAFLCLMVGILFILAGSYLGGFFIFAVPILSLVSILLNKHQNNVFGIIALVLFVLGFIILSQALRQDK